MADTTARGQAARMRARTGTWAACLWLAACAAVSLPAAAENRTVGGIPWLDRQTSELTPPETGRRLIQELPWRANQTAQAAQPAPDSRPDAANQSAQDQEPYVLLQADEVTYDEKTGVATAMGNVEIAHGQRVLRAEKVVYDDANDRVSATGNVVLLEPTGEVVFADHADFTQGMKDGIIRGFKMLLADNSRLAGTGGQRTGGVISVLNKAVFSPCDLCEDDPEAPPLWRIRAVRVIHDSDYKEVEYKDAFLEIFGIPVAYTPYLSHPDPTVERRSGILSPSYASDSEFGLTLAVPYFWEINESEDITFTPHLYTDENNMYEAEYRRRFTHGEMKVNTSYTDANRRDGNNNEIAGTEMRGHFFAEGRYDINELWRVRGQIQHASDDTYLRRYRFEEPSNTLTSSFNAERFEGRDYAEISAYSFQGLRENDDPGETPLVLPYAYYDYVSKPFNNNSYLTANFNTLALHRTEGTDTRRVSFKGGWHLPYTADTGEIYKLSALLQTDAYWVSEVATSTNPDDNGMTGRVFPQLMAEYRWPFIRDEGGATQLVEPVAAVIVGPNGGNPDKIPNEDSQDLEFDDTNLFSPNRYTGFDRVEGGQRFVYGLNWGLYGHEGGAVEAFIGQNYSLQSNNDFSRGSGLSDQMSDVVGRLRISPSEYFDFLYRFRVDPDGPEANRNELQMTAGPPAFRFSSTYFFINEEAGTGQFGDREELSARLSSQFSKYWSGYIGFRENLAETNGGPISRGIGLTYQDECLVFLTSFTRSFTSDRDLQPTDTLFFRLIFKHLGEFQGGS